MRKVALQMYLSLDGVLEGNHYRWDADEVDASGQGASNV